MLVHYVVKSNKGKDKLNIIYSKKHFAERIATIQQERGRGIKCHDDYGAGSIEVRDTLSPTKHILVEEL